MEAIPYILPIIILLLAVGIGAVCKFLPIKSLVGAITLGSLSFFLLVFTVCQMFIVGDFKSKIMTKTSEVKAMQAWKYHHLDEMSLLIAQLPMPTSDDEALLKTLQSYGWQSDSASINHLKDANLLLEELKASKSTFKTRYLIKGIPTKIDNKIIELALRNVGFKLIPYKTDDEIPEDVNIMYYGKRIDTLSVKLAALTLIRAGIGIKAIKPFKKVTRGNARAIKIDWSKYVTTRQTMTADSIGAVKKFK